ncbi:MAG: T9SS type A sorting domain-containing protein [Bacteroidota bacterium]
MKQLHLLILFCLLNIFPPLLRSAAPPPPPANDGCGSATNLTTGSQLCGQNASGVTLQTNECYISFVGATQGSMWYSFNATSSTMVLNFLQTNATNCAPYYIVWGPYSSVSAGCSNITSTSVPCASAGGTVLSTASPSLYVSSVGGMSYNLLNGDPGNYITLNGLSTTAGNNTYLIQMVNNQCGGPLADYATFCIGVNSPASNSSPSGASIINSCGTQYNGTTGGGYSPSNCMQGNNSFGNIDCNSSTSCPSSFGGNCNGTNGNNVPFVVNNPSFFTFCATANGTYNINFDVGTCQQPQSGAQGAQMAILIGSTSSMTLNQVAPNPMLPSSAVWTSSNFSLAAGQCAYLVVDGFAGDQCTYSYTLNNVGGGCLLPIELITFSVDKNFNYNKIYWATATEKNNAYFTLEKSPDGINYAVLGKITGADDSYVRRNYEYIDEHPLDGITYYQLSQTDYDGTTKKLGIVAVQNDIKLKDIEIKPNPTSETAIISIPSHKQKDVTIRLTDIAGKIIEEKNVSLESGDNYYEIRLSPLEKGLYFVQITGRDINQSFKLVKE